MVPGQSTPLGSGGVSVTCPRVQSLRSCILGIGSAILKQALYCAHLARTFSHYGLRPRLRPISM